MQPVQCPLRRQSRAEVGDMLMRSHVTTAWFIYALDHGLSTRRPTISLCTYIVLRLLLLGFLPANIFLAYYPYELLPLTRITLLHAIRTRPRLRSHNSPSCHVQHALLLLLHTRIHHSFLLTLSHQPKGVGKHHSTWEVETTNRLCIIQSGDLKYSLTKHTKRPTKVTIKSL